MNRLAALPQTVLSAIFVTALLAGCGNQPSGAAGAGAVKLQERVRTVRQLVSEQDPSAALAELHDLSADVAAAGAQGDLSPDQQQRAEQALGSVRTDLESMVQQAAPADAPVTGPPAAPEAAPSGGGGSGDGQGQDEEDCDSDGEGADRESWSGQEDQSGWQDRHDGDEDDGDDDED
jgi:hypothetical protein